LALKDAIARDWEAFDGVENATIIAQSARLADVTCANTKVLRRALTKSAMMRFGGIIFEPGNILIDVWDYRQDGANQGLTDTDGNPITTSDGTPIGESGVTDLEYPSLQTILGREIDTDDLIQFSSGNVWRIHNAMYSHMTSRWSCRCSKVLEE
jgi:hypothetical protein